MNQCTETGCPRPILGVRGLMGGMVLCREHVFRFYPGCATIEEAQHFHASTYARALGYGEDHGDDVRQDLAEWLPNEPSDIDEALLTAYRESEASR